MPTRTSRRPVASIVALVLVVPLALLGCASKPPVLTEEERQLNARSFDMAWELVRDNHYDAAMKGIDWVGVSDELRPQVEAAATMPEARAVMGAMLDRLGETHYGVIPREQYEELSSGGGGSSSRDGRTGVHLRVVEGVATVWRVEPDSPADRAGVRTGWQLLKVEGRDAARVIEIVSRLAEESATGRLMVNAALNGRLRGAIGEQLTMTMRDAEDRVRDLTLTLDAPLGVPASLGFLPPSHLTYEDRVLPSGVAYLTFNIFLDPAMIMRWFGDTVKKNADAPGIIIDLRDNPGGIGAMSMGMGNWFVTEPNQRLGTMKTRQTNLNFVLNPRPDGYRGPVAVLIDESSASTSEFLAGGLQAIGRARVFGATSAGAALPSRIERLPNGDGIQFAMADYVTASGARLEGVGVTPDEVVALDRASLLAGRDTVVEAAERWILSGGLVSGN